MKIEFGAIAGMQVAASRYGKIWPSLSDAFGQPSEIHIDSNQALFIADFSKESDGQSPGTRRLSELMLECGQKGRHRLAPD